MPAGATWLAPAGLRHPHGRTQFSLARPYIGVTSIELPARKRDFSTVVMLCGHFATAVKHTRTSICQMFAQDSEAGHIRAFPPLDPAVNPLRQSAQPATTRVDTPS